MKPKRRNAKNRTKKNPVRSLVSLIDEKIGVWIKSIGKAKEATFDVKEHLSFGSDFISIKFLAQGSALIAGEFRKLIRSFMNGDLKDAIAYTVTEMLGWQKFRIVTCSRDHEPCHYCWRLERR